VQRLGYDNFVAYIYFTLYFLDICIFTRKNTEGRCDRYVRFDLSVTHRTTGLSENEAGGSVGSVCL